MSVVRDTNVPVDSMTQILTTRQKIVCGSATRGFGVVFTNVVVQNSHLRLAVTELTLQALRKDGLPGHPLPDSETHRLAAEGF